MKISNPGQTNGYKKKNYFSIKKGTQVFRILPALGEAADRGKWYQYYEVHFGYRDTENKMFVFQSPEVRNSKTKMIEVSDAAKERNAKIRAKMADLVEKMKISPDDVKLKEDYAKLKSISETFNSEKRYYYNAIDINGNIGLLKLKMKEKAALEAARKTLEADEGVDPVKIEGAYLVFTKSGDGQQESTVQVSGHYLTEEVGGKKVRVLNTHKVDESLFPKLEVYAHDLLNLFTKPTADEVKAMVDGGRPVVKAMREKYYQPIKTESKTTVSEPEVNGEDNESEDDIDSLISNMETSPSLSSTDTSSADAADTKASNTEEKESDDDFLASMGLD